MRKHDDLERLLKKFIEEYIAKQKRHGKTYISRDMIVFEFLTRPGEKESHDPAAYKRTLRAKVTYIVRTYYSFDCWNNHPDNISNPNGNHWSWKI